MKKCSNCNIQFEDSRYYCNQCGQRLVTIEENTESNEVFKEDTDKSLKKQPLNNWTKVFLSILVPGVPLVGPIVGLIFSLYFIFQEDKDRKTFGSALLVGSILFIILSICLFLMFLIIISELTTEFHKFF